MSTPSCTCSSLRWNGTPTRLSNGRRRRLSESLDHGIESLGSHRRAKANEAVHSFDILDLDRDQSPLIRLHDPKFVRMLDVMIEMDAAGLFDLNGDPARIRGDSSQRLIEDFLFRSDVTAHDLERDDGA